MLVARLELPHRLAVGLHDSLVGRTNPRNPPGTEHICGFGFNAVFHYLAWLARGTLGTGAVNDPVMLHHGDHNEEDEEF
jgi:hypothetical protein